MQQMGFGMRAVSVKLWGLVAIVLVTSCEVPTEPVVPTRAALASPIFLPWDQVLGRVIGDEAASEGPMAFALDPQGGYFVLDQVNQRVLELDASGRMTQQLDLPAPTFEDLRLYDGRALLVLDRFVGKVLRVMDRRGELLLEHSVEGRGIERAGAISALLPRPDGVWLEVDRRHSVRVLDQNLQPCQRQIVYGRPIANGQSLRADLSGDGGARISIGPRTQREARQSVVLMSDEPIARIPWVEADERGQLHVILHEVRCSDAPPFETLRERYLWVRLDGQLQELERVEREREATEFDQHVEFRLDRHGQLWQMAFSGEGVTILQWERGQR